MDMSCHQIAASGWVRGAHDRLLCAAVAAQRAAGAHAAVVDGLESREGLLEACAVAFGELAKALFGMAEWFEEMR